MPVTATEIGWLPGELNVMGSSCVPTWKDGEGMNDHTYKYESAALTSPVTVTSPHPSLAERFMLTSGRGNTVISMLDVSAHAPLVPGN